MKSQATFSAMFGDVFDGNQIAMDNGETLTLRATLTGWQLVNESGSTLETFSQGADVERFIVTYH